MLCRVKSGRPALVAVALGLAGLLGSPLSAGPVFQSGHGDIGLEYEDGSGEFELHVHLHEGAVVDGVELLADEEYAPHEITIQVPGPSVPRPPGSEFDFIGVGAGQQIWRLFSPELPETPFLGVASEELDPSDWTSDVTWSLVAVVSAPPGGEFSIWQNDIGGPNVGLSTFSGITSFTNLVGGHEDYNWAFTKAGVYQITLGASAVHAVDGTVYGEGTFTFQVVPEPGSLTLAGIGIASFGALRWRRRATPVPGRE